MLANASSASLPGITPATSLTSDTMKQTAAPSLQVSPARSADGNNNKTASTASSRSTSDSNKLGTDTESKSEAGKRRAASFKRAMRMQPLNSLDLDADMKTPVGSLDSSTHMDTSPLAANGQTDDHEYGSSFSECEDSSDTDSDERCATGKPATGAKLNMYSSMPALHSLQRKPAQKRKSEGRLKALKKTDPLSKSSDHLVTDKTGSGGEGKSSGARQYRKRWEGSEDGLRKKVPALHDSYTAQRSRENLLRKKGLHAGDKSKRDSKTARLTNWGSVDKLTHGSLSDLSHLKEDPWVRNMSASASPSSSPLSKDFPRVASPSHANTRSFSLSATQSKDWNPGNWSTTTGRPRNKSDAAERSWTPGKENLDWIVYLNRNSTDPDFRERANSLSQLSKPCRRSGEIKQNALRDSNSLSRSSSLCKETMKRYSLELPDKQETSTEAVKFSLEKCETESVGAGGESGPADETQAIGVAVDKDWLPSTGDEEVVISGSSSHGSRPKMARTNVSPPAPSTQPPSPPFTAKDSQHQTPMPSSPIRTPSSSQSVHQLLSPRPFSPRNSELSQVASPTRVRSTSSGSQSASPCGSREMSPQLQGQDPVSYADLSHSHRHEDNQPKSPARPLSSHTAAMSKEGDLMVAEMQKYYDVHSPKTPSTASKFPFCEDIVPLSQPSEALHHPLLSCDELNVNVNRLSGVSSVSSSSNDGYVGAYQPHHLKDPNPNRLSGVSSISTSSYESQNSTSSDSIVGTLKNKLSVWTHKLGGRKSRDEDSLHSSQTLSVSRDGLASPSMGKTNAELQDVLREHALGSPHIGSRMANTLPVGFEPLLSPSKASGDEEHFTGKEDSLEPQTRFSFPGMGLKRQKHVMEADAFSVPTTVQQSDSGISVHSCDLGDSRQPIGKASTLPANINSLQQYADVMEGSDRKRKDSESSVDSGDSYYERRLSVAFHDNEMLGEGSEEPRSPSLAPRKSIREVVQFIEEKFRPHQPSPMEVRRREPSTLIRQRLQSLRDNSTYRRRASNRSVSEDRTRVRESTPESPRISRPEQRGRGGNQFMHRVQAEPVKVEREVEPDVDREMEQERELELVRRREAAQGRESEERSEASSSNLSRTGSMSRLEQLSNDIDNLVIMRGWVRNLINKFQQFK